VRRREFIALFSSAATWPQVARAQPRQLPLIGILAPDRPPFAGYDALLESLRGLGQIEGLTHVRETRWAEGQRIDLYRQYAKELDGRGAHVIVTGDTPGTIATHDVSKTTPMVLAFMGAGDPIELGFATSLARPGGMSPGFTLRPTCSRASACRYCGRRCPPLNGLRCCTSVSTRPAEQRWQADGVLLTQSAVFYRNLALLAETAMRHRMRTLSGETGFAAAGGLMDQGPDIADAWRRSATFVDKSLKVPRRVTCRSNSPQYSSSWQYQKCEGAWP
jgi:putative ABC transport system substrate-binding protein